MPLIQEHVGVVATAEARGSIPHGVKLDMFSETTHRGLRCGRAIFHAYDMGAEMYVVLEGEVELTIDSGCWRRLGPGEPFGEMALTRPGAPHRPPPSRRRPASSPSFPSKRLPLHGGADAALALQIMKGDGGSAEEDEPAGFSARKRRHLRYDSARGTPVTMLLFRTRASSTARAPNARGHERPVEATRFARWRTGASRRRARRVIDVGGRTLMPGLYRAHMHAYAAT